MSRIPEPSREAQRIDAGELRRFGIARSLLAYFDKRGLWTQPYWRPGEYGKVWRWLRRSR